MRQRLRELAQTIKARLEAYRALADDPRTPRLSRWLLGAAVAYVLLPFDLIPDWLPLLGQIDDVVIVPLLLYLALRRIPENVRAEQFGAREP